MWTVFSIAMSIIPIMMSVDMLMSFVFRKDVRYEHCGSRKRDFPNDFMLFVAVYDDGDII